MKINQTALQTGMPKGTFMCRDPHPTDDQYIFKSYRYNRKNIESWADKDNNCLPDVKVKIKQRRLQTGKPKGAYTRQDPHPTDDRYVYDSWNTSHNQERWTTMEKIQKEDEQKRKWTIETDQINKRRERYNNDPEYRAYILSLAQKSKAKPENRKRASETEKKRRKRVGNKALQASQKRTYAKRPEHYRKRACISARRYNFRRECQTHNLTKAEKKKINLIYRKRDAMNNNPWTMFTRWVVDHIIPLNCNGLHEPNNLQIVPNSWNSSKQDRNHDTWNWTQLPKAA